jgi:hypothetical protein
MTNVIDEKYFSNEEDVMLNVFRKDELLLKITSLFMPY